MQYKCKLTHRYRRNAARSRLAPTGVRRIISRQQKGAFRRLLLSCDNCQAISAVVSKSKVNSPSLRSM